VYKLINKMVRKRAPAQKGLSPEKRIKAQREKEKKELENGKKQANGDAVNMDENAEHLEDITEHNESTDSIKEDTTKSNDNTSGDDETMETKENNTTKETLEDMFNYDELPDAATFAKELSEKAFSFWEIAQKDHNDFTNWTCLLQTVTESEDNLDAARGAYNCFLRYYPYCYGYWKKFADVEKKAGKLEEAEKVFMRGVEAIPVSIDLWVHYLNFTIQQNKEKKDGEKKIRSLFEQALEAAGMEFRSNKLWDAYINWENSLGNLKHVTEIYDQLIAMPTQQYLKNWQKFKKHLENHPPKDVLPTKEYNKLIHTIAAIPPGMTTDVEDPTILTTTIPPGESKMADTNKVDEDEEEGEFDENEGKEERNLEVLRHKIISERESIFVETAEEIKKRWQYEDGIKRPYFHVKPLEKSQIKNWKEYLDYELREGGRKRICFLFERCMVACALYEEFWDKYLNYIEKKDIEIARNVFKRACTIHNSKKFNLHLRWAVFEEKNGNYDAAAHVLKHIDTNFPGMILITQRRVALARRMNDMDAIEMIFESVIGGTEKIEDKIYHMIKYSHCLAKFMNNKEKARDVLWKALALGKKHRRIYLQLLDLELHYGKIELNHVEELFIAAEKDQNLSDEFLDLFSQRQVEFYSEYCDDVERVFQVKEKYEKLHKKRESIKRHLSESNSSDHSSSKISKTDQQQEPYVVPSNIPIPPQDAMFNPLQQQNSSWYQQNNAEDGSYYDWNSYYYNQANQQQDTTKQ